MPDGSGPCMSPCDGAIGISCRGDRQTPLPRTPYTPVRHYLHRRRASGSMCKSFILPNGPNLECGINMNLWSPVWAVCASISVGVLVYLLHQALLPQPLPGIPHEVGSAKSILGDLPAVAKVSETGSMLEWLQQLCYKHSSPLVQVFIAPLGKPFLVLGDFREARDVLVRRIAEWDRADWAIDGLGGIGKHHHIVQKTGTQWKLNRRLIKGLMSPPFLRSVAAPNIYQGITDLLDLWELKADVANGLAFDPSWDVSLALLDCILPITFGRSALVAQSVRTLDFLKETDLKPYVAAAARRNHLDFPAPVQALPDFVLSILRSSESIADSFSWPRPSWYWAWHWLWPSHWRTSSLRTDFVRQQVASSLQKFRQVSERGPLEEEERIGCAVDFVLERELDFARREERSPAYFSEVINDELYGFIIAGHDTSTTTARWGLKFLSDNPVVQTKLRQSLHDGHPRALAEGRLPTVEEMMTASIPYRDAAVEEILRLAGSFSFLFRQATCDTVLLGHFIPRGTQLLILQNGPDTTLPGVDSVVQESDRSTSSQKAALHRGVRAWDPATVREFRPERWLVPSSAEGSLSFDGQAGPTLAFSDGVRGCYGRRLAYLQLKIMFTLLVWRFELLPCAPGLSSYAGLERLTRGPKQCYIRLKSV
ncbi:hypothetical protein NLU13_7783 [Sarocladium strictum]|uniref:Cytochrome P450 n=1 Tax=Sarocladium strictum TaxID=5046 RepID=A0AA39L5X2_SARSR|nr:hypothetical protein NLU13_7783 [Sarocladium strictum]